MARPKLKSSVDPSHVALDAAFNTWAESLGMEIDILESHMVYSQALQKYVFSVVYAPTTKEGCKCKVQPGEQEKS